MSDARDNKSKTNANDSIKKPIIKNNTLMLIILVIGLIIAVAIFVMNMIKSNKKDSSMNEAEIEWHKISDYIVGMISEGELDISYVYSSQRKQLFVAGSNAFFSVQHNGNNLYFGQGTYTQTAANDDMKIAEAKAIKGMMTFSEHVTDFSVENYNQGTNSFSDGTVKIRMRVEKDGSFKQDTFTAKIPVNEE